MATLLGFSSWLPTYEAPLIWFLAMFSFVLAVAVTLGAMLHLAQEYHQYLAKRFPSQPLSCVADRAPL